MRREKPDGKGRRECGRKEVRLFEPCLLAGSRPRDRFLLRISPCDALGRLQLLGVFLEKVAGLVVQRDDDAVRSLGRDNQVSIFSMIRLPDGLPSSSARILFFSGPES